jgi:hypothetical protein
MQELRMRTHVKPILPVAVALALLVGSVGLAQETRRAGRRRGARDAAGSRPATSQAATATSRTGETPELPGTAGRTLFNAPNPDIAAVVKLAAKAPPLPPPKEPVVRVKDV